MIDSLKLNWVYHFPILPNGGKNWTRTSNIEVGHILTVRLAEEVGLEPTDKFSMCKIQNSCAFTNSATPPGIAAIFRCGNPGLQDCVQAT